MGCAPVCNVDAKLIASNTCTLPCWNGITPGVTNQDEAKKILEEMEVKGLGTLYTYPDAMYLRNSNGQQILLFENGVVRIITLASIDNTTLGGLLKCFGKPSGEGDFRFVGGPIFSVHYFDKGLSFIVVPETNVPPTIMWYAEPNLPPNAEFHVTSDSQVIIAYLFSEGSIPDSMQIYRKWEGYGPRSWK